MRVLDLDLDFFVHGVDHTRSRDHGPLDSDYYRPWSREDALNFLTTRCQMTGPLPGFAVKYHADAFGQWRKAIEASYLNTPFSVTHVDAHADLGLGDAGYQYLMADLLFRDPDDRWFPEESPAHLADGNFLSYALACRWISDLTYVYNEESGGDDLLHLHMKDYDREATALQLKAVKSDELKRQSGYHAEPEISSLEPEVPFERMHWAQFQAQSPFDVICLARSPNFTPPDSEDLFEEIRQAFVDEEAWNRLVVSSPNHGLTSIL